MSTNLPIKFYYENTIYFTPTLMQDTSRIPSGIQAGFLKITLPRCRMHIKEKVGPSSYRLGPRTASPLICHEGLPLLAPSGAGDTERKHEMVVFVSLSRALNILESRPPNPCQRRHQTIWQPLSPCVLPSWPEIPPAHLDTRALTHTQTRSTHRRK